MRNLTLISLLALLVGALTFSGCGSEAEDEDSQRERVRTQIAQESQAVLGSVTALDACGTDARCLQSEGERAVDDMDGAIARIQDARPSFEGGCEIELRAAALAYLRALRAYALAAREGEMGDAFGLLRTVRSREGALLPVQRECGFAASGQEDPVGTFISDLQDASVRVNDSLLELDECDDFSCAADSALEIEQASSDAIAILEGRPDGASECREGVFETYIRAFTAHRNGARLVQENEIERGYELLERGLDLSERALADLGQCPRGAAPVD